MTRAARTGDTNQKLYGFVGPLTDIVGFVRGSNRNEAKAAPEQSLGKRIGQPRARTVEVPAKFRKLKHKRKFEPEENA
ncbi:unnamed protein product [Sphagnum tenellum]